jgi:hypothetical protein
VGLWLFLRSGIGRVGILVVSRTEIFKCLPIASQAASLSQAFVPASAIFKPSLASLEPQIHLAILDHLNYVSAACSVGPYQQEILYRCRIRIPETTTWHQYAKTVQPSTHALVASLNATSGLYPLPWLQVCHKREKR